MFRVSKQVAAYAPLSTLPLSGGGPESEASDGRTVSQYGEAFSEPEVWRSRPSLSVLH